MNIAKSVLSRLFLLEDGAHPDTKPEYVYFVVATDIEESYSDMEGVFVPDPNTGAPVSLGMSGDGTRELHEVSLSTRYLTGVDSLLSSIAGSDRRHDFHLHFGLCENPSLFNDFQSALVLEEAVIGSVSRSDMGALESGENAVSMEESEISARDMYSLFPSRATILSVPLEPVAGLVELEGIYNFVRREWRLYALDDNGVLYYSGDSGGSWQAYTFDEWVDATPVKSLVTTKNYLIGIGSGAGYYYINHNEFEQSTPPSPTLVTKGFSISVGTINGMGSYRETVYFTNDLGRVYKITEQDIEGGLLTPIMSEIDEVRDLMPQIESLGDNLVVIGGNGGFVQYTEDGGETWVLTRPALGVTITSIELVQVNRWFIGLVDGRVMYTTDKGETWNLSYKQLGAEKSVGQLRFANRNVGFVGFGDTVGGGAVIKTYDGGYSWVEMPDNGGNSTMLQDIGDHSFVVTGPNSLYIAGTPDSTGVQIMHLGIDPPVRNPVDYVNRVLSLDPIAYWRINEDPADTSTIDDATPNNVDVSHTVDPTGKWTEFPPKTSDDTVLYDGINDYTNVYSSKLPGLVDETSFSVSVWVKVAASSVWTDGVDRPILELGSNAANRIEIGKDDPGRIYFTSIAGGNPAENHFETVSASASWIHIAMVVDGANSLWRAYIQGEEIHEEAGSNCGSFAGSLANGFCYLATNDPLTVFWSGSIAHMVIFDGQLDPAQVMDLADKL